MAVFVRRSKIFFNGNRDFIGIDGSFLAFNKNWVIFQRLVEIPYPF